MTKRNAIKLACELSHRKQGEAFHVIRCERQTGRPTNHVVHGGIAEIEQLSMRLSAESWEHVAERCKPVLQIRPKHLTITPEQLNEAFPAERCAEIIQAAVAFGWIDEDKALEYENVCGLR